MRLENKNSISILSVHNTAFPFQYNPPLSIQFGIVTLHVGSGIIRSEIQKITANPSEKQSFLYLRQMVFNKNLRVVEK